MKLIYKIGISIFFLSIIFSCAANKPEINENTQDVKISDLLSQTEPDTTEVTRVPETPPIVPLNPRIIEVELQLQINNIQIFQGDQLRNHNLAKGIPTGAPPQLYVWSSGIAKRDNQTILDLDLEGPAPLDIFIDSDNENQIYFWDLSSLLKTQKSISITRRVKVQSFELFSILDTTNFLVYDIANENYLFYTKPEQFIELNEEITEKAIEIAGSQPNPFQKAKLIFDWVNNNMTYFYPPPKRGAAAALETLKGDKGQYSYLFIALCRAVGVPARFVAGFQADETSKMRYHTWAEFLIPEHGWLPADPTYGNSQFGKLNNKRIIASVGNNIQLKHAPYWATFNNSEVENSKAPFMQLATIVHSGINASFKTNIKTIRYETKENDILSQIKN